MRTFADSRLGNAVFLVAYILSGIGVAESGLLRGEALGGFGAVFALSLLVVLCTDPTGRGGGEYSSTMPAELEGEEM